MAGGELYGDLDRKLVELELVSVDAQACRVVDGLAGKTHESTSMSRRRASVPTWVWPWW